MAITLPAEEYIHETQSDGRVVTYCTMRQIVLHTIGLDGSYSHRHRPYHRHGKCYYKPWRNYFSTTVGEYPWNELEREGYAAHGEIFDYGSYKATFYYLTRKGFNWLGEQLGMHIHDEAAEKAMKEGGQDD